MGADISVEKNKTQKKSNDMGREEKTEKHQDMYKR